MGCRLQPDQIASSMSFLPTVHPLTEVACRWCTALEKCCRALDYDGARLLFAEEVCSFGTYATFVKGREALEREQWRNIWPVTRDFAFRLEEMHCVGNEQGLLIIVTWEGLGINQDGTTFPRGGRCTLFLVPRKGGWVGVHTHFSLVPRGEQSTP